MSIVRCVAGKQRCRLAEQSSHSLAQRWSSGRPSMRRVPLGLPVLQRSVNHRACCTSLSPRLSRRSKRSSSCIKCSPRPSHLCHPSSAALNAVTVTLALPSSDFPQQSFALAPFPIGAANFGRMKCTGTAATRRQGLGASQCRSGQASNPSIERTNNGKPLFAAHVKR